ncbi:MAG: tetratricopeptide repeat protein [Desulfobacterales bacterium]|jgi:tetratricopeptide (TPR) repeat protein
MPKKHLELYHTRESTRHFLHSKAETVDREKKRSHTPAQIQKALQSAYPDLFTDHSFLSHAAEKFSSAKIFACVVFQIDDEVSADPDQKKSNPAAVHKNAAKLLDDLCRQHNGTWGLVNSGLFGAFFEGIDGPQCLKLSQKLQKTLKNQINATLSVGIAEYPVLDYKPAEMFTSALKALEHASFFGPNSAAIFDAVSLNISGDRLFDKGDIKGSVQEFHKALKLDPSNINVHNSLGVCYGLLGDYDKAKLEFNAAIKLNSNEVMGWYNLGFTNMLSGHRNEALNLFLKANSINQDVFEVAFQTGRLLMEMEQPESGKKYLEHASRLQPKSGAVFRYLGECYASIDKIPDAIVAYKKAIKHNPSDAASLSAMGCLFDEQGENPEISVMFCRESVKLSPENGLYRYRLGQLYYKQNRLDDALKEFKKAELLGQETSEYITKIQTRQKAKAS